MGTTVSMEKTDEKKVVGCGGQNVLYNNKNKKYNKYRLIVQYL